MPKDFRGGARGHDSWRTCGTATSTLLVDNSIASFENTEAERDPKVIEQARAKIAECFDRLEKELEGREYLAGAFQPWRHRLYSEYRHPRSNTGRSRSEIQEYPRMDCPSEARPSFAASAT